MMGGDNVDTGGNSGHWAALVFSWLETNTPILVGGLRTILQWIIVR